MNGRFVAFSFAQCLFLFNTFDLFKRKAVDFMERFRLVKVKKVDILKNLWFGIFILSERSH